MDIHLTLSRRSWLSACAVEQGRGDTLTKGARHTGELEAFKGDEHCTGKGLSGHPLRPNITASSFLRTPWKELHRQGVTPPWISEPGPVMHQSHGRILKNRYGICTAPVS